MLETGIPNVLWRTKKYNDKLYGEIQTEEKKFLHDVDTNYNPALNERLPSDKGFTFKKEVSDFGLSDAISNMKFAFKSADNNLLLNEQLPSEHKFRRSVGLGGLNKDFDSMAPKTDYRYVDPQYYEYRLNGMTIEKLVENKRGKEKENLLVPDELDPTSRAIYLRNPNSERYENAITKIQSGFRGKVQRENYLESFPKDKGVKETLTEGFGKEGPKVNKLRETFDTKIAIQKAKRRENLETEYNEKVQNRKTKKDVFETLKDRVVKKKAKQQENRQRAIDKGLVLDLNKLHSPKVEDIQNIPIRNLSHRYGTRSKQELALNSPKPVQTFVESPSKDVASKRISGLLRRNQVQKGVAKEVQERKEEVAKASPTLREKMAASALNREKELQEFNRIQEEAQTLRESTSLQIKTYENLKEKLGKLNPNEYVPKSFFPDIRPVYAMNQRAVGTKYKVSTVINQLEKWEEKVQAKKNHIAQEQKDEQSAKEKEDRIFRQPKSSNIKTLYDILADDDIPEEEESARSREIRNQINPAANDIHEIISARGSGNNTARSSGSGKKKKKK
jgi:hypothetical protein